ncbi:MAG: hypothetical protein LBC41_16410, partial [Clostridiales bacterium]|nr:hypothetical protein [Clostridiales bacterium]
MKKMALVPAALLLAAMIPAVTFAWLTDFEQAPAAGAAAAYGHVDIDINVSAKTYSADGELLQAGSLAYPGAFTKADGTLAIGAKAVLEYELENKSSLPVLVRISQSGLKYAVQRNADPALVQSADFALYTLQDDYFFLDTPPLANGPYEGGQALYADFDKLTEDLFFGSAGVSPSQVHNITNEQFYKKTVITVPVGDSSGTGILMAPKISLDPGVRLATDNTADWVYAYMPPETKASIGFELSLANEASNSFQYSVLALNTS